jgi:DNA-directed RNA polymerase subunit RPC12/RpoP
MDNFEQLTLRIRKDPDDLDAWKAISALVDDPKKKMDCQQQIDRINAKRQPPVVCPKCGAGMNIYFAGEMHDKRAKCPYCGTEIDIPDDYSKVVIEKRTGFDQFLPDSEAIIYERRSDNNGSSINTEEINKLIMEKGLTAARQELDSRGIKGLKIDDIGGVDKSSEAYKIIQEKGLKALEKSQGVVFVTPKQVNVALTVFIILFALLFLGTVIFNVIQFIH